MTPEVTAVLAWLGSLGIAGLISSGISYWIFQVFGKVWLETKFQKELEQFKTLKQIEVEQLKSELARYADRAIKFNTREYDVLPEAWKLMKEAIRSVSHATSQFDETPQIDDLDENQLNFWIEQSDLTSIQKQEIKNSASKSDYYIRILNYRKIDTARECIFKFRNFTDTNGAFIDQNLLDEIESSLILMNNAITDIRLHEINERMGLITSTDYCSESEAKSQIARNQIEKIEGIIRSRLNDTRFKS